MENSIAPLVHRRGEKGITRPCGDLLRPGGGGVSFAGGKFPDRGQNGQRVRESSMGPFTPPKRQAIDGRLFAIISRGQTWGKNTSEGSSARERFV